jgi:hypothetical protein
MMTSAVEAQRCIHTLQRAVRCLPEALLCQEILWPVHRTQMQAVHVELMQAVARHHARAYTASLDLLNWRCFGHVTLTDDELAWHRHRLVFHYDGLEPCNRTSADCWTEEDDTFFYVDLPELI